jgi:hypothetical protein
LTASLQERKPNWAFQEDQCVFFWHRSTSLYRRKMAWFNGTELKCQKLTSRMTQALLITTLLSPRMWTRSTNLRHLNFQPWMPQWRSLQSPLLSCTTQDPTRELSWEQLRAWLVFYLLRLKLLMKMRSQRKMLTVNREKPRFLIFLLLSVEDSTLERWTELESLEIQHSS